MLLFLYSEYFEKKGTRPRKAVTAWRDSGYEQSLQLENKNGNFIVRSPNELLRSLASEMTSTGPVKPSLLI